MPLRRRRRQPRDRPMSSERSWKRSATNSTAASGPPGNRRSPGGLPSSGDHPGTGKTETVRAALAGLVDDSTVGGKPLRIAVAAGTYTAVDNVLRDLMDKLPRHWPEAAIRRLRSRGRQAPAWLPAVC